MFTKWLWVGAVVIGLSGFVAGWSLGPERVKTVEDTTRIRELVAQLEKRQTHQVRTTVKRPDGTVETKTTTDTHVDKTTQSDTAVTLVKRSEAAPQWHAGVLLLAVPTLSPLGADLYAGGMVSRQLFGPVSVGLTATVPVRQPVSIPTFGLSLSVGF